MLFLFKSRSTSQHQETTLSDQELAQVSTLLPQCVLENIGERASLKQGFWRHVSTCYYEGDTQLCPEDWIPCPESWAPEVCPLTVYLYELQPVWGSFGGKRVTLLAELNLTMLKARNSRQP